MISLESGINPLERVFDLLLRAGRGHLDENPGVIVDQVDPRGIGMARIGIPQMPVKGDIEKTRIEIFRHHVDVRQVQSAAQGDFLRKNGQTGRYIVYILL